MQQCFQRHSNTYSGCQQKEPLELQTNEAYGTSGTMPNIAYGIVKHGDKMEYDDIVQVQYEEIGSLMKDRPTTDTRDADPEYETVS